MPELPEMETYRRLLEPRIINRRITDVEINRERSINLPIDEFRLRVVNRTVIRVERIAKQLIFRLDDGNGLAVHLMLGGWMFFGSKSERPERTIQVRLEFGEKSLHFINLRLGHLHWLSAADITALAGKYGPDPFAAELTEERWDIMMKKKRSILKTALVDQSLLAGIGNCYSDEICHAAGILPTRIYASLSPVESRRLLTEMRRILADAVRYGGYMEHPLYVGDTLTGGYDERCQVYGREGEPCARCHHPIILETVRARKTYYCKDCQR